MFESSWRRRRRHSAYDSLPGGDRSMMGLRSKKSLHCHAFVSMLFTKRNACPSLASVRLSMVSMFCLNSSSQATGPYVLVTSATGAVSSQVSSCCCSSVACLWASIGEVMMFATGDRAAAFKPRARFASSYLQFVNDYTLGHRGLALT